MGKTRNGIYNNLKESEYKVNTGNIVYVFSSEYYMGKFLDQLEENRNLLSYSLYKRFKIAINFNDYFDIILYSKIEKRGFLIYSKGEMFECQKSLVCDGVKQIKRK